MQLLHIIPTYFVATRLFTNAEIDIYFSPDADLDRPEAQFRSMDANFGPPLPDAGIFGQFVLADPEIACDKIPFSPFEPKIVGNRTVWPIVLIKRGQCEFDLKVFNGQNADYAGVIVYDNIPADMLIPMGAQNQAIAEQIQIPSVFAAWETGEALISYLYNSTESAVYVNILPDGGYPWPPTRFLWPFAAAVGGCLVIMLVSTVIKLARDWRKSRRGRLSRRKLNQLPIIKFVQEEHGQRFDCCAICLEEFKNGDKIRELPCKHGYHKQCIDPWLTANRKVCPLCKRTVLPSDDSEDSESEEAPLLPAEPTQNDNQDEVRVVGWARGFANQLQGTSGVTGRGRTSSVSSYQSTGEVNEAADFASSDDNLTPPTAIRPRAESDNSSNDGDDEDSPRQLTVTI